MDQKNLLEILKKIDNFFQREKKDYWVIGGIAIVGLKGSFFRDNEDIDLLIWRNDFSNLLEGLRNEFKKFRVYYNQKKGRDRIYIKQDNKNIIEIMPIESYGKYFYLKLADDYNINDDKLKYFSEDLLQKQEKQIDRVRFIIPSEEFIYILTRRHYEASNLQRRDDIIAKKIKDLLEVHNIIGREKVVTLDNKYFNNKSLVLAGRL